MSEMEPRKGITFADYLNVKIVNGQITDFWKRDDSHTVARQLGLRNV